MASQTSTELPSVASCLSSQYGSYTAEGDHTEQASTKAGVPDEDTKPTILWGPHGIDRETWENQPRWEQEEHQKTGGVPPSARSLWIEMPARPLQILKFEPRRLEQQDPPRGGGPGNYQREQNVSLSQRRNVSGVTSWCMSGMTTGWKLSMPNSPKRPKPYYSRIQGFAKERSMGDRHLCGWIRAVPDPFSPQNASLGSNASAGRFPTRWLAPERSGSLLREWHCKSGRPSRYSQ